MYFYPIGRGLGGSRPHLENSLMLVQNVQLKRKEAPHNRRNKLSKSIFSLSWLSTTFRTTRNGKILLRSFKFYTRSLKQKHLLKDYTDMEQNSIIIRAIMISLD